MKKQYREELPKKVGEVFGQFADLMGVRQGPWQKWGSGICDGGKGVDTPMHTMDRPSGCQFTIHSWNLSKIVAVKQYWTVGMQSVW